MRISDWSSDVCSSDLVESTYGFGIKNQLHRGLQLVWHDGSTYGSKSALLTYPAQGLDIVVMANRSDSEPSAIAVKIAETLLADTLENGRASCRERVCKAV